jgi:hypothetical protein
LANILALDDEGMDDKLPSGGEPLGVTLSLPELQVERTIKFFDLTRSLDKLSPHIVEL